ncbi:MAG TPA: NADH-quinone oxidoreductase subunit N [Pirellulaceae bacterium]|nr:NADH-quinone oxidoreductase subunit N [Pirellulaceae bacterium]
METFFDSLRALVVDTKGDAAGIGIAWDSSVGRLAPELALCGGIVLILLARCLRWTQRVESFWIAILSAGTAFWLCAPWQALKGGGYVGGEAFTGMLELDGFALVIRGLLLLYLVFQLGFTRLSGIPDREDGPDVYTLYLGASVGMCLMASANHLLAIFLAVEMASVPSYLLVGSLKGRPRSSEAAVKYAVFGAVSSGAMLYGLSLLGGLAGTAHLPSIARALADQTLAGLGFEEAATLAIAGLMILGGLGFKVSLVPFHFWCPDAFEGAPAEVGAFLSVASKAAAVALVFRMLIGLGTVTDFREEPSRADAVAASTVAAEEIRASDPSAAGPSVALDDPDTLHDARLAALRPFRVSAGIVLAALAAITCTFGNLAAFAQTNLKRLMAYSTIAHAGYLLMPACVAAEMADRSYVAAVQAVASVTIYLGSYVLTNLGAFAVIAFVRNELKSESLDDWAGIVRRRPALTGMLAILFFSLIGLPPFVGFLGKFAIFASLAEGYRASGELGDPKPYFLWLLVIGCLNTALSLFYYVRVVKRTVFDEPSGRTEQTPLRRWFNPETAFVAVPVAATVLLFVNATLLIEFAEAAAQSLLRSVAA